jgi:hypothetical protein
MEKINIKRLIIMSIDISLKKQIMCKDSIRILGKCTYFLKHDPSFEDQLIYEFKTTYNFKQ